MRLALFTIALLVAPAFADDTTVRLDPKAPAKDEAIEKEITGAKTEYTDALKKAKAELGNAFDTAREKIASSKMPGDQKLGQLETLVKEKSAFEYNGYFPSSPQMQPAVQSYLQTIDKARQAFRKSVESAAKPYRDRKDLASYEAVLKDTQAFLDQTPVEGTKIPAAKWTIT